MVLIPPNPPFSSLPTCCAAAGRQKPFPPFPKAVEWLDSSKPCLQSKSLFRAIVWPRRRSRPSRGVAPLRVYFGCSDWVCGCLRCIPRLSPGKRGSIHHRCPAISTTLDFPAGIAFHGGVCVHIPGKSCGSKAGRLDGTFLTLYVHRSVFQAAQRTRGIFTDSDRVLLQRERSQGLFLSYACSAGWEQQADKTGYRPGSSQDIMLGKHQRLSAVPGAVAICSVPPPVRPRRDRRGVKFSLHWLVDTWDDEKRPLTNQSVPYYRTQNYDGSQGLPSCEAVLKQTSPDLPLVIGRYTPIRP